MRSSTSIQSHSFAVALRCTSCGERISPVLQSSCNRCFGPLEVVYDEDSVSEHFTRRNIESSPQNIWRYWPLLPVDTAAGLNGLNPGMTPLRECRNLARALGIRRIFAKDDTVNPTYSFKDRPVAVSAPKAVEFGLRAIGCASTGNLAGATAAAAAKYGLPCYVFVPEDLPESKLAAASVYGGRIIKVRGNYDTANRIANLVSDRLRIGLLNINLRPYYLEGSKTLAFEVVEQLGWEEPDRIIVPMGSGALLTAVRRGLFELHKFDLSNGSCAITGTQPLGCSPISAAFGTGEVVPVENPSTVAESLAIGDPASGADAIRAIKETGGFADAPSDEQIIEGQHLLAREEGIYSEPAGGCVVATLKRGLESGAVGRDETVVCLITGNGLKTGYRGVKKSACVSSAREAVGIISEEGGAW